MTLEAIWCTHHHFDHTAGNEQVAQAHSPRVFGHSSDQGRIPRLTDTVDHGDTVSLGELTAKVLFTPGHTTGGIVY